MAGMDWKNSPPGKIVHLDILGKPQIEFPRHALDRMSERGVTEEEVLDAILKPDGRGLPTRKGRHRVRKQRNSRIAVDVVYETLPDRVRVITIITVETGLPPVSGRGYRGKRGRR